MADVLLTLKNDLRELDRLALVTEELCGQQQVPPEFAGSVNLALDELVTNIISYGYGDQAEHEIQLRFSINDGFLTIVLEDDGQPFNPLERLDPGVDQPLEERQVGGLGVFLVRNIMDQLEYRRAGDRNILTMRKNLPAQPPPEKSSYGNC